MMYDFGPLPGVHPRHDLVERARVNLQRFLLTWADEHALTFAERFMLLGDVVHQLGKSVVSVERRKDPAGNFS